MAYLKEEAESQPDLQDPHYVPFEKKTRGKVFKKKEKPKSTTPLLPDDLSDVLDAASEDDLLELAGKCLFFSIICSNVLLFEFVIYIIL